MDALQDTKYREWSIENVAAGETSSRLSSAIFFLLCLVPVFSTILFGGVDYITWVFVTIFAATICLLWLFEAWRAKGLIFNANILQLPILGLLLIGLVQLLPIGETIPGNLLEIPCSHSLSLAPYITRFFIGQLIVYIIFFAATLTFLNSEKRLKTLVFLIVIFGAVMAFIAIILRLADPETIYGFRSPGQAIPFGPFVNQHHFAAFMELTGGLTLALILARRSENDKRVLLSIALAVMLIALIMTSSRGGILSFTAILAFILLVKFVLRERYSTNSKSNAPEPSLTSKFMIGVGGVVVMLLIVGTVVYLGGGDSLLRGIGASGGPADVSNGRTHFWSIALRIFLDHPFLGSGLDTFGTAFSRYDSWNGTFHVERAHNEYLQILAESGITGFACLVSFIFFLFKRGLATIANTGNAFRRNAAIGALAGCFGILIHSFFDFPLRTPSNAFFFLLLVAIATVAVKTASDGEAPRRKRRSNAQ